MPPYDPSTFPPFAVTVDLVVLTVRRHALCALVVRRGKHRSRAGGRCPAVSSGPTRISGPRRRVSSSRRRDCAPTIRRSPPWATARTSNSWPPTGTRRGTPGCGSSASRTSRSPRTCPRPGRAGTPTAPAGHPWRTCSGRASRPHRSPSTTRGSLPTGWNGPAPRSSTPRWPRRSARRSSRSVSCAGCTRRCGAWSSTRATSTARSRAPRLPGALRRDHHTAGRPARAVVPGRCCHGAQPADAAAGGLTAGPVGSRGSAEHPRVHCCAKSRKCRVMLLRYPSAAERSHRP